MGSEACTLFRLGTDVRYSYVSVGVRMHPYYTISKHRYELAAWFSHFLGIPTWYRHSAKTDFFDTFFTNWLRGSTLPMLRQANKGQRVAPLVTALPQALN